MFNKMTTFLVSRDDVEILDGDLLKTAALKLPEGVIYDPDFFYMKVRAVSAGEYWGCNKNQDYFPENELNPAQNTSTGYKTFLTAHTFKNHENKDIKNAIGDVLVADWNDKMKSVELLLRIDRKIAPTVVRGFEKGFMTDVSMGCRISYSVCSICGNKAKTKFEYCDHIKFQRGKILEDGRKVYEINIGPKFHDISAVLNGAERSAKAIGLMIVGDKIAFEQTEESLEKVASFSDAIAAKENQTKPVFTKVAAELDTIDLDMNMYNKMDKKAYVQKIAEIKKELQGKMVEVAKGDYILERQEKAEHMAKLMKLLYENYWDRKKCNDIARQIKFFAEDKNLPVEMVFDQFLKVLNFAGIELTPLELHDIVNGISGHTTPDIRQLDINSSDVFDGANFADEISQLVQNNSIEGMNLPSLFKTISQGFIPNQDKIVGAMNGEGDPLAKTKATIIMIKKNIPSIDNELVQSDIMDNFVRPLMEERSMHRNFLVPRLIRIVRGEASPNPKNINHFAPVKMLKNMGSIHKTASVIPLALSGLMYSTYQNERLASCLNGELQDGINKFANEIYGVGQSEFCKTASRKNWGAGRAILIGIPATYAYSAFQRARLNNGQKVNTINRYIAENPGNAALLQVAFSPALAKGAKKLMNTAEVKGITPVDEIDDMIYKKFASVNTDSSLYQKDMFKDASIDNKMLESYSSDQLDAIKMACVYTAMQKQDFADDVLCKHSLHEEDLEEYLKTASDCIKIEIEKVADTEFGKQIATGIAGDMLFNPKGISALAAFPGNLIDSLVFTKLFNATQKDAGATKKVPVLSKTSK
jgi:hypothetical protein